MVVSACLPLDVRVAYVFAWIQLRMCVSVLFTMVSISVRMYGVGACMRVCVASHMVVACASVCVGGMCCVLPSDCARECVYHMYVRVCVFVLLV